MKEKQEHILFVGHETGKGLRETSRYEQTQQAIDTGGITDDVLNKTPPIGLNLELLAQDSEALGFLQQKFANRNFETGVLGLAISAGVRNVRDFLTEKVGSHRGIINVFDIDEEIISEVSQLHGADVIPKLRDARDTGLSSESQDLVIRDHLGNCCPPAIDEAIDAEVARILKPGGIAIVNITTSELLSKSQGRDIVRFDSLHRLVENSLLVERLQEDCYNLKQLIDEQPFLEVLRSKLVEIQECESFVVFGEDSIGHGEWFRSFKSHQELWERDGFVVKKILQRDGTDSHTPPLQCRRQSVILEKK